MPLATSLIPTANKKAKPATMQARTKRRKTRLNFSPCNTIMETYLYKFCMLHWLIKH